MNCVYETSEWRLFIDSSNSSLKCVLLNNGGKYASIPIGNSVSMKESYETIQRVLTKLDYSEHNWVICGDLKVLNMLLRLQEATACARTSFVCGTAERTKSTGSEKHGLKERNL